MSVPSTQITKVLIANRGEIAIRIMRTLKDMGITSYAIFTEPDRGAPHTLAADVAIALPDERAYLNIPLIVKVAKDAGVHAIHPGYGFLSERPEFAEAVAAAGIIFIGPTAEMIASMGSKIGAKVLLQKHAPNVPFVPGFFPMPNDPKPTVEDLVAKAKDIGFPLLVKAAAGGGGKGMRVIRKQEDLASGIESAMTEARNAFGDDSVMLEKYLEGVKHIEIQIFGDLHGNVMHLYERECSVQRRHQKLIEESPSPFVTPALRQAMGEAACSIARVLKYCNAGTVEFIVDPRDSKFYFLEVNTRLQVEHTVTECVVGLDLVKAQILVASGKTLKEIIPMCSRNPSAFPFPQQPVGHAVEIRVYAENDEFKPCTGSVMLWKEDKTTEGVHYHSTVVTGSVVSVFYDGLLTKIVAYAPDSRQTALNKMVHALRSLICLGLQNNKRTLIHLLNHEVVRSGAMCTDFIDKTLDQKLLTLPLPYHITPTHNSILIPSNVKAVAISTAILSHLRVAAREGVYRNIPAGFRNTKKVPNVQRFDDKMGNTIIASYSTPSNVAATRLPTQYSVNGLDISLQRVSDVVGASSSSRFFEVVLDIAGSQEVAVVGLDSPLRDIVSVHVGSTGEDYTFGILEISDSSTPATTGPVSGGTTASTDASGGKVVKAPMPAKVLKTLVKTGDVVKAGDVVVILESMKMETKVTAPVEGVATVAVKGGDLIQGGKTLFTVHPPNAQKAS